MQRRLPWRCQAWCVLCLLLGGVLARANFWDVHGPGVTELDLEGRLEQAGGKGAQDLRCAVAYCHCTALQS
jgi:hypothetical protein